jgi:hypothetical protein
MQAGGQVRRVARRRRRGVRARDEARPPMSVNAPG